MLTPEALALKDPLITFLHSVLVSFDFEAAQAIMADCCSAIASDFFLSNMVSPEDFLGAARSFLFDVYCRVCQKIDLRLLATQVHMTVEEAERWVVSLVRSAQLDAKVDSEGCTVEMLQPPVSLHWNIAGARGARARAGGVRSGGVGGGRR
jgi:translation initiation factor 3 subunit E